MTCLYCNKDLVNDLAYEDAIYAKLVAWLCDASCIKWVRGHPNYRAPNCTDGQHGAVLIRSYDSDHVNRLDVEIEKVDAVDEYGDPIRKTCRVLYETERIVVDLSVYLDNGENLYCGDESSTHPQRSSTDVLRHIKRLMKHAKLTDFIPNFRFIDAGQIDIEEFTSDGMCWYFATMRVEFELCTITSYPLDGDLLFYCAVSCSDDLPLCIAKPTECEE